MKIIVTGPPPHQVWPKVCFTIEIKGLTVRSALELELNDAIVNVTWSY